VEGIGTGGGGQRVAVIVGELEPAASPGGADLSFFAGLLAPPAAVSSLRATVRSPASDLGTPWAGSQPSWVICQRIVDCAADRSVSGRRSPQLSPRRSPRR